MAAILAMFKDRRECCCCFDSEADLWTCWPSCLCSQDVYDKLDYLSSLGKTQTAAVQRDADIGVAEAERDAGIRVSKEALAGERQILLCSTFI